MTPNALNDHHLLYFWLSPRKAAASASELLHVSQPSISAQLQQLRSLWECLFLHVRLGD